MYIQRVLLGYIQFARWTELVHTKSKIVYWTVVCDLGDNLLGSSYITIPSFSPAIYTTSINSSVKFYTTEQLWQTLMIFYIQFNILVDHNRQNGHKGLKGIYFLCLVVIFFDKNATIWKIYIILGWLQCWIVYLGLTQRKSLQIWSQACSPKASETCLFAPVYPV